LDSTALFYTRSGWKNKQILPDTAAGVEIPARIIHTPMDTTTVRRVMARGVQECEMFAFR
jgi:hypothetical protein